MNIRHLVPSAAQPTVRTTYRQLAIRTPKLRMLPAFMVIGGQRCGTTTVFKLLENHPQVLRPPIEKGTDYFTLHYDQSLDWYRSNFSTYASRNVRSDKSSHAVSFEACTYYMFHPFALERIAKDLPDVKLVAMLRDPVERAYSAYKHELARGFETEPDFMHALAMEDSRLEGELDKMAADLTYESIAHRHHAYRRRGQFAEQVAQAYKLFPRNQIHLMDSGRFFSDPANEYGRLLDFLELERHMPQAFPKYNARPGVPIPENASTYLTTHYVSHDQTLEEMLGYTPSWR